MATYTAATYAFDLSVTGNYQALMGDIDSKIQSLGGWTYVSQTGDANPASTVPGSNNTYPAFRLYSTTVGSTTWYLRVDFGHNSGPSIKVQLGTANNGSGTLSGQTSTQITLTAPNVSASQSLHMAAAAGRLMIFFGLSASAGSQGGVSIHGNVDGSGSMVSGVEVFAAAVSTFVAQYVPASGTVQPQQTVWPSAIGVAAANAFGGVVPLFPPQLWDTTGANNPSIAVFKFGASDLTTNTTTTVSLYGTMRTFIVASVSDATLNGNQRGAFRFD